MADDGEKWAIYGRRSHMKGGPSVPQQVTAGERWCQREGKQIFRIYTDIMSASRYAIREREDWMLLRGDMEEGAFTGLWLYESSRGDRTLSTWADFLERTRQLQVRIYVEAHERLYRPWLPRDWETLATDGVKNAVFSDQLGQVVRRGISHAAEAGKPHSWVKYGYARTYDPATGDFVSQDIVPAEADIIREIVWRFGAREPVSAIRRDLEDRGVTSPAGTGSWNRTTIRKLALSVVYVGDKTGKRVHLGTEYDAVWPAIITPLDHARAVAVLTDPERRKTRPGAQKYLLSYEALCGECGDKLEGQPARPAQRRRASYRCASMRHCVTCPQEPFEGYIRSVITGLYDIAGGLLPGDGDEEAAAAARAEAEALRAQMDEHARMAARGEYGASGPRMLAIVTAELGPQIASAEKRAAAASAPPPPFDPRDGWDAPVPAQKAVIRAVLGAISGKIELMPARAPGRPAGGSDMDYSRVRIAGTVRGEPFVIQPASGA